MLDKQPSSICTHLASESDEFYVLFTGRGCDRYWVCPKFAERYPTTPSELIDVAAVDGKLYVQIAVSEEGPSEAIDRNEVNERVEQDFIKRFEVLVKSTEEVR